ncbi:11303_t:CDS:2, partial [Gigaspora margarita]
MSEIQTNNRSSSNDSILQDDIQSPIINTSLCIFDQAQNIKNSSERIYEFDNCLERDYELKNNLENDNKFTDYLSDNEFKICLESNNEFVNKLEIVMKSDDRFKNRLEWDNKFDKESENDDNNSLTSNITSTTKNEDMCINNCCAYSNNFSNLNECPFCKEECYQNQFQRDKPCRQFAYFSIIDYIIIQYQDITQAKNLFYHSEYVLRPKYYSNENIGDVFDGQRYKNLVKKDDCWILLFLNASLPPEQHVKKENLLISTIMPGHKEPKDLNSFLFLAISELHELEKGIEYSSHNSYSGCCYCNIMGTYSSHVYYSTQPLKEKKSKIYNPANLPLRTHNEFKRWIQEIQDAQTKSEQNQKIKCYGISKRSILFDLNTTNFSKTFPVDIMHLFYENIAGYLLNHWIGSFFTDPNLNDGEYVLSLLAKQEQNMGNSELKMVIILGQ